MRHKVVPAGKFKANCLKLMDEVNETKVHIQITKRNVIVAELVPVEKTKPKVFGWMKGTGKVLGDIIQPIDEKWDASS